MANVHFGNLADVFKHLALCEVLGMMRPAEYWESHVGAARYAEGTDIPFEREHGVHRVASLLNDSAALRTSRYGKALAQCLAQLPPRIPGSSLLARMLLGDDVRRLLLCDTDTDALHNVREVLAARTVASGRELSADKLECVADDGVSVLRGACMLLPEHWAPATLALVDPYDIAAVTASEISSLQLACELANRKIATLLFYTFVDPAGRTERHQQIMRAMEKACLLKHGTWRFEGCMKSPPVERGSPHATQWGFGLLAFSLSSEAAAGVDQVLRSLEAGYAQAFRDTPAAQPGAWAFERASL